MRVWIAVALLVFAACEPAGKHEDGRPAPSAAPPKKPSGPDPRPTVTFGDPSAPLGLVHVEVVETEPMIEQGLMFRQHMPPDDGMLFLLEPVQDWKFWMRNTLISLDIVFITTDHKVAGVSADAVPRSDDLLSVGVPSHYVVEVNAGWCAAHHVTAGTPVTFTGVANH